MSIYNWNYDFDYNHRQVDLMPFLNHLSVGRYGVILHFFDTNFHMPLRWEVFLKYAWQENYGFILQLRASFLMQSSDDKALLFLSANSFRSYQSIQSLIKKILLKSNFCIYSREFFKLILFSSLKFTLPERNSFVANHVLVHFVSIFVNCELSVNNYLH